MSQIIVFVLCFTLASVQLQKLIANEGCKNGETYEDHGLNLLRDVVHEHIQEISSLKEELRSLRDTVDKQTENILGLRNKLLNVENACGCSGGVQQPGDCKDILKSGNRTDGVYTIYPLGSPVNVFCDMTTDGGGWTILMTRSNFSLKFDRPYADYRKGFGSAYGAYWIGLDIMNNLTTRGDNEVYFKLVLLNGTHRYARYNNFTVGPLSEGFRLTYDKNSYTGNAGDGLYGTNIYSRPYNMRFTTYDHDEDNSFYNCASVGGGGGGWWYNGCFESILTSMYKSTFYWKFTGLQAATMMIR